MMMNTGNTNTIQPPAVRESGTGEIKKAARGLLMNGWNRHILISIALIAVFLISGELASAFSASNVLKNASGGSAAGTAASSASSGSVLAVVLSAGISFVLLLLASLFLYGAQYYFLNVVRKKEFSFRDIAYAFKNQPDKYLILSMILVGVYIISTLPIQADLPFARWIQTVWMIAGVVFFAFVDLELSLAPFIMFDHEDTGVSAAMRESVRMMKGRKKTLLLLILSFIGYYALGICSYMIGFLWVIPYVLTSVAVFYDNLPHQ